MERILLDENGILQFEEILEELKKRLIDNATAGS